MTARSSAWLVPLLVASWGVYAARAQEPIAAPRDYEREIRGIIERRCGTCHGADVQEGGISFAELEDAKTALRKRPLWKRALRRVNAGSMPPEDAPPLGADERKLFTEWLRFAVEYVDCDPQSRDPGPSPVRRLNRTEYFETLRDLMGVDVSEARAVGLPDDGVLDGFDNQASALTTTAALVEKYFAAADSMVGRLFGDASPEAKGRSGQQGNRRREGADAASDDGARRAAYERLFVARPSETLSERDAAAQVISNFVRRAFRRAADQEDVAPLLALFERARGKGEPFDVAIRATLKPVLVSPHFLYRIERDRPAAAGMAGVPVDGHELAVRLSYFLWSTMPDDELFAAAESGRLLEPGELERQARRLLADARGKALTDNFAAQWLQLPRLADARPTTEFFPKFTVELRDAMRDETLLFCDMLRREDRSILDLLDADYTFVNGRLAEHYGITGVTGDEMRRVALAPDIHRGGVLGMASILSFTSHTFRTSPTQRGKYVLDVIFGTPPPPPPANAGVLKEDRANRKSPQTFREQLAQHATEKSCAGCHAKLDPLGFALDNFDAIGAWRDSTADVPLDVAGVLPTGERLEGPAGLKRVLLERKDEFARNFIEKLLTYALGRELDHYDECTVREVEAEMIRGEYRLSSIVLGIVKSPTFRQRRPAQAVDTETK